MNSIEFVKRLLRQYAAIFPIAMSRFVVIDCLADHFPPAKRRVVSRDFHNCQEMSLTRGLELGWLVHANYGPLFVTTQTPMKELGHLVGEEEDWTWRVHGCSLSTSTIGPARGDGSTLGQKKYIEMFFWTME
jgi:hypothetical protein